MELYLHPDNLIKGKCYRVYYRGMELSKGKSTAAEFMLIGIFKDMLVAYHGEQGIMNKKVLMVTFRKFGEEFPRVLDWRNIVRVEEVSKEEEAYKKAE